MPATLHPTSVSIPTEAAPGFRIGADLYLASLRRQLDALDLDALARITRRFRDARDVGATIYVAGNGGSAATATHWVNDLCKAATRSGRARIRAMCLSDSTSWLTALSNDEGYERSFAGQLETFTRPGDVLALISASGNSPNLLAATRTARDLGASTVALLGFDGGALREMVDDYLLVPTPIGEYGLVESVHSVAADLVTTYLIADRPDVPG